MKLQFALRQALLGKIRIRPGLPLLKKTIEKQNEALYYHLLLSRTIPTEVSRKINQVVDIGCRNWSYAPTLADFFPKASLVGIEVDGGRRYWNLYRRMDFAQAMANQLSKEGRVAHFYAQDFEKLSHLPSLESTAFCFFFPFVSDRPCIQWGLPTYFVRFLELLRHAQILSLENKTPCIIMSAHQGEWEAEIARKIYQKNQWVTQEFTVLANEFVKFWSSSFDTHLFSTLLF